MTSFRIGVHEVQMMRSSGRWIAVLDGVALPRWFMTEAEAWTAGVREADRIDRCAL